MAKTLVYKSPIIAGQIEVRSGLNTDEITVTQFKEKVRYDQDNNPFFSYKDYQELFSAISDIKYNLDTYFDNLTNALGVNNISEPKSYAITGDIQSTRVRLHFSENENEDISLPDILKQYNIQLTNLGV